MTRASASAMLAAMVLAGCGGGNVGTNPNRAISEAQRTLALASMSADLRRAALRPALPSGTRVYAVDTETFSAPGGILVMPRSSVVSFSGTTLVWRLADGTTKTTESAKLIARDRSGETYVLPGKPVPASLQGQTPEEVTR